MAASDVPATGTQPARCPSAMVDHPLVRCIWNDTAEDHGAGAHQHGDGIRTQIVWPVTDAEWARWKTMAAPTDDMTPERAIEVVAQRILWLAARNWPEWEQYPEIGERDWYAVLDHIDRAVPALDNSDEFTRAYALLTKRAEATR